MKDVLTYIMPLRLLLSALAQNCCDALKFGIPLENF